MRVLGAGFPRITGINSEFVSAKKQREFSDVCSQFAVSTKIVGSDHVCLDPHNCFGKHFLSLDRPLLANSLNSCLSLCHISAFLRIFSCRSLFFLRVSLLVSNRIPRFDTEPFLFCLGIEEFVANSNKGSKSKKT